MRNERETQELIDWIRSRPPAVQAMMQRFPPACTVRAVAGKKLLAPAPGTTGVVVSYVEKVPSGAVNIRVGCKETGVAGECVPEWIEFVSEGEITREFVKLALAK